MEFRDPWGQGDGERGIHCWKLFMTHFPNADSTKYSIAAFNVLFQTHTTLFPNVTVYVETDYLSKNFFNRH